MAFRRAPPARLLAIGTIAVLVAIPLFPGAATAHLSGQLAPYVGATGSTGSSNATNHCATSAFTVLPWVNATAGLGGFYDTGSARTCASAPSGSSEVTQGTVHWTVPVALANSTDVIEARLVIQTTITWNVTAGACIGVNGTCPSYQELGTWTYFEASIAITDRTTGKTHAEAVDTAAGGTGYIIYGTCSTCRGLGGGTTPTGHLTATYEIAPSVPVPTPVFGDSYVVSITVEAQSFADAIHVGGPVGPSHAEFSVLAGFSLPAIQQA